MHRLAAHDARRLHLHAASFSAHQGAFAVYGLAEGIYHPAEQGVAHRNRQDVAGRADGLALLDLVDLAEHHRADGVFVQVQGQADGPVLKLKHLVDGRAGQPGNAGDAVAHLGDPPHLGQLNLGLEPLQVATDCLGDGSGVDGQLCHCSPR